MVSSGVEAKTCGTFNNGQTVISIRPYLITLEHKQPETPLKTDNSTSEGFIHSVMKPKHLKTWDMKYNWLQDKELLEQLIVY